MRRELDPAFAADIDRTGMIEGAHHTGDHPRFQAMAFGAYAIATPFGSPLQSATP